MSAVDLFVIGGGSGGVRAARRAAEAGARVALAEEYRLGGTCVIRGCVPKKLLVHAASFPGAFDSAAGFGWDLGPRRFDWGRLIANKDREIARLEGLYRAGLDRAGVAVHAGRARIAGPGRVRVDGVADEIPARHILVATGGAPFVPAIPGAELAITSNEAFHLPELPRRIVVVGGGYIACEFACIFRGLGAEVRLLYRGSRVLRGFDEDLCKFVTRGMEQQGITVATGADVAGLRRTDGGIAVRLAAGGEHEADLVLYATGRRPNTAGLGLAAAGVELGRRGEIRVDEVSASTVAGIHAVGDVTDRINQTPVAIREAEAFVATVFAATPTRPDHAVVPLAVFTRPELATVGATEAEARAREEVRIYRTEFSPLSAALGGGSTRILMKLVVSAASGRVLGVHLGGPGSAELIQCLAIAVKMGATKDDFDRVCAVHPTAAEEIVTLRETVA